MKSKKPATKQRGLFDRVKVSSYTRRFPTTPKKPKSSKKK